MITVQDIPLYSGSIDGISTRVSDKPLVIAWKERNGAVEEAVWTRPLDNDDVNPPAQFDEILDVEDAHHRALRQEQTWFVSRDSPQFQQADREMMLLLNFYQAACGFFVSSLKRYERIKVKLLEVGYPLTAITIVPPPPAPIHLLHLKDGCTGEIHKGLFKGQKGMIVNFVDGADYRCLFCTVCGWINRNYVHVSYYVPTTTMDMLLEDLGPELLVPNPDIECNTYMPDFDLEPGDDDSSLREAEEKAKEVTRRCMKAYGLLLSVSYRHASHHIRSWPDPDDRQNRLVFPITK